MCPCACYRVQHTSHAVRRHRISSLVAHAQIAPAIGYCCVSLRAASISFGRSKISFFVELDHLVWEPRSSPGIRHGKPAIDRSSMVHVHGGRQHCATALDCRFVRTLRNRKEIRPIRCVHVFLGRVTTTICRFSSAGATPKLQDAKPQAPPDASVHLCLKRGGHTA